jgi:hypothetical protein
MRPTPEQKEFLQTHSIMRCPSGPITPMCWGQSRGSNRFTEEEILRWLASFGEPLTLNQKFEIDRMRKAARRLRR